MPNGLGYDFGGDWQLALARDNGSRPQACVRIS